MGIHASSFGGAKHFSGPAKPHLSHATSRDRKPHHKGARQIFLFRGFYRVVFNGILHIVRPTRNKASWLWLLHGVAFGIGRFRDLIGFRVVLSRPAVVFAPRHFPAGRSTPSAGVPLYKAALIRRLYLGIGRNQWSFRDAQASGCWELSSFCRSSHRCFSIVGDSIIAPRAESPACSPTCCTRNA